MKLTLRQIAWTEVQSYSVAGAEKVIVRGGYHAGFASFNARYYERPRRAKVQEAIALDGGIIVIRFVDVRRTKGVTGRITRGTGVFRVIEGIVTGRNSNHLKLTYHFDR